MTSETIWRRAGSVVAGKDACAQKRASTRELLATCRESRVIIPWVKRNTAATSRLPPRKSPSLRSSDRVIRESRLSRSTGGSWRRREFLEPIQVGTQRRRDPHRADWGLMVLEQRRVGARQRHAGCVQGVRILGLGTGLAAEAHVHPARLEVLEVRARRAFEPLAGSGGPHLEVVALGRGEAEV